MHLLASLFPLRAKSENDFFNAIENNDFIKISIGERYIPAYIFSTPMIGDQNIYPEYSSFHDFLLAKFVRIELKKRNGKNIFYEKTLFAEDTLKSKVLAIKWSFKIYSKWLKKTRDLKARSISHFY